jgi:hypothetical protein
MNPGASGGQEVLLRICRCTKVKAYLLNQKNLESMVSGFPEKTVAKQGSLVFRKCESSEAERERSSPLERTSVFARNARHHAYPHGKLDSSLFLHLCGFKSKKSSFF